MSRNFRGVSSRTTASTAASGHNRRRRDQRAERHDIGDPLIAERPRERDEGQPPHRRSRAVATVHPVGIRQHQPAGADQGQRRGGGNVVEQNQKIELRRQRIIHRVRAPRPPRCRTG